MSSNNRPNVHNPNQGNVSGTSEPKITQAELDSRIEAILEKRHLEQIQAELQAKKEEKERISARKQKAKENAKRGLVNIAMSPVNLVKLTIKGTGYVIGQARATVVEGVKKGEAAKEKKTAYRNSVKKDIPLYKRGG